MTFIRILFIFNNKVIAMDDLVNETNNFEETKQNIRNFSKIKTENIIEKYEIFLSPLADELLEKQRMTKKEFVKSLNKLINKEKISQKTIQNETINEFDELQYNIKTSGCNCNIL